MNIWLVLLLLFVLIVVILITIEWVKSKHISGWGEFLPLVLGIASIFSLLIFGLLVVNAPKVITITMENGKPVHTTKREFFYHKSPFTGEIIRMKLRRGCIDNYLNRNLALYAVDYASKKLHLNRQDNNKKTIISPKSSLGVRNVPYYYFQSAPNVITSHTSYEYRMVLDFD